MKVTLKEVKGYTNEQLVDTFEKCNIELTHEVNSRRGQTKATTMASDLLKQELLNRLAGGAQ